MKLKRCHKCEQDLPVSEFYSSGRGRGPTSPCKRCRYKNVNRNYRKNKQERLAYARNYWLLDQYGITSEQYEEIWRQQEGRCALCGRHDDDCEKRLFVDHCHDTGKIRGLLCPPCNTALGVLGDTEESIRLVLEYMSKECLTKSL